MLSRLFNSVWGFANSRGGKKEGAEQSGEGKRGVPLGSFRRAPAPATAAARGARRPDPGVRVLHLPPSHLFSLFSSRAPVLPGCGEAGQVAVGKALGCNVTLQPVRPEGAG